MPSIKKYIDLKLILLLAGFYTLFDIIYVGKMAYFRHHFPRGDEEPWGEVLLYTILIDWLVVVTYMTLIAISTKRLLNKNYPWEKIIVIHTVLSIMIGFFIRVFFDLFGILSGYIDPAEYEVQESLHRFMAVIDLNFLIYFAMVFIIYTYYYLKEVKENEKHRNLLETQLVNTRMKMLSSQLQPHFLFNTLNSISVLADLDPSKAKDTIADLSDFLREILYSSDENEITLEKELRTLEYYLNILSVRFSGDLRIRKDIDNSLLHKKVPALLLQPLIENSIKHGYNYDHAELEVVISVKAEGDHLLIKVENNGASLTAGSSDLMLKGLGLSNLNDRLKNLYGTD
ncbi:MAG TPA: histidine kinase, partial [Gillisia sp.]|nr:histidine kinase [Gillisia sp.]